MHSVIENASARIGGVKVGRHIVSAESSLTPPATRYSYETTDVVVVIGICSVRQHSPRLKNVVYPACINIFASVSILLF